MIKFKYGCGIVIGNSWDDVLKEEIHKDYFKKLVKFLNEESKCKEIYPKSVNLFRALKLTDYKDVNVVIGSGSISWWEWGEWIVFFC